MTVHTGKATALIVNLRDHTSTNVALRRADSAATEHYAYPYLAPLWADAPWAKLGLLKAAALAAHSRTVHDDRDVPFGRLLQRIGRRLDPADPDRGIDRIGQRLVWAQTGDVTKLHTVMRQFVPRHPLEHAAVSWKDVIDTYVWWDQPNAQNRLRHRRKLLERFYQPLIEPTDQTATEPSSAVPTR